VHSETSDQGVISLKKLLFAACAFFCLAAVCMRGAAAQDSGYDITSYTTDIDIGYDNTYHIAETITADFICRVTESNGLSIYLRDGMGEWEVIAYNTASNR
jgi:uncharacterized membrane protein